MNKYNIDAVKDVTKLRIKLSHTIVAMERIAAMTTSSPIGMAVMLIEIKDIVREALKKLEEP